MLMDFSPFLDEHIALDHPHLCAKVLAFYQDLYTFKTGVFIEKHQGHIYLKAESLEDQEIQIQNQILGTPPFAGLTQEHLKKCWEKDQMGQLDKGLYWIPLTYAHYQAGLIFQALQPPKPDKNHPFWGMILYQAFEHDALESQYYERTESLSEALDDLRMAQGKLVSSEKMAALGSLVAGIAHELNTPIGISVTASTTLMDEIVDFAKKYQADQVERNTLETFIETIYQNAQLIFKNNQRSADLIQSFKKVSIDQSEDASRLFHFKAYLEDIVHSLQPHLKCPALEVTIDCPSELVLNSYPGIFAQIFTNLILNSSTHGYPRENKGVITIRVKKRPYQDQSSAINALISFLDQQDTPENPAIPSDSAPQSDILEITYHDDGQGIPEHIQDSIFDPFVTTNKQKGSGLGMHIVYNLVTQKLKGSIECTPTESGAYFKIVIPFTE